MAWLAAVPVAVVIALAIFIVATDGRYFGKGLVHWVYDRFGPAIFASRGEPERWRELAGLINLRGDEAILDVGTAVGDLPLALASMPGFSGRAVGIDWSASMVKRANAEAARRGLTRWAPTRNVEGIGAASGLTRKRDAEGIEATSGLAHFEVVDVRQGIPFPDEEFDVVICMGLVETLPDPEAVIGELCRVLNCGGTLVVSVYKGASAAAVALSQDWYEERLAKRGLGDFRLAALRRSQDILIARKAN